jgi:hypothetical protein
VQLGVIERPEENRMALERSASFRSMRNAQFRGGRIWWWRRDENESGELASANSWTMRLPLLSQG